MDPKDCSPSDAVLAVSRLLAPAGGRPMPRTSRAAVVAEAARFFGVPSALLLELPRPTASSGSSPRPAPASRPPELHEVAGLPALEDFVAGAPRARRSTRAQAAALTAALAPEAQPGAGQLIAVGADVLVLAGARPVRVLRRRRASSARCSSTRPRPRSTAAAPPSARGQHDPPARAHARGEDAQRVARARAAARPHLRGGDRPARRRQRRRLPRHAGHRLRRRRHRGPAARVPRLAAGARHRARRAGRRARPADADQRLPGGRRRCRPTRRSSACAPRSRCRSAGTASCAACSASAGSARTGSAPRTSRCWRRSRSWPASPAATPAPTPTSRARRRPTR